MPAMPTLKTQMAWFTRIQWLLAGCVALTAVAFYGMVYRPETTRLAGLTTTIGQRERELTAAQSQARVMQQVQEDINHLNEKLKDLKNCLQIRAILASSRSISRSSRGATTSASRRSAGRECPSVTSSSASFRSA
jgi:hypothetical protein